MVIECNVVQLYHDQYSPGPWFNIKMSSYQYRKSHCGDKMVVRSSYLHNGISYTGKMTFLYWFDPQNACNTFPIALLWGRVMGCFPCLQSALCSASVTALLYFDGLVQDCSISNALAMISCEISPYDNGAQLLRTGGCFSIKMLYFIPAPLSAWGIIFWGCPSVCSSQKFSGISWRIHGRNGLKFDILIYPDYL